MISEIGKIRHVPQVCELLKWVTWPYFIRKMKLMSNNFWIILTTLSKIKLYKQFWNLIIANKFAGVIFINVIFFLPYIFQTWISVHFLFKVHNIRVIYNRVKWLVNKDLLSIWPKEFRWPCKGGTVPVFWEPSPPQMVWTKSLSSLWNSDFSPLYCIVSLIWNKVRPLG